MTISANVRKELFEMTTTEGKLIRIKPTEAKAGTTVYSSKQAQPLKMWTQEEHEKFLEGMEKYPSGPWKVIAAFIGTKTTRQTMTHAQKYRQKISRWRRGLRHKGRKSEQGLDSDEECSGKDNLFKAIEYMSNDVHIEGSSTRINTRLTDADAGNQLFRLAQLASIEVRQNHNNDSLSPTRDENIGDTSNCLESSSVKVENNQGNKSVGASESTVQYPLFVLQEMSLAPVQLTDTLPVSVDHVKDQARGEFRLPPLKVQLGDSTLPDLPQSICKVDASELYSTST